MIRHDLATNRPALAALVASVIAKALIATTPAVAQQRPQLSQQSSTFISAEIDKIEALVLDRTKVFSASKAIADLEALAAKLPASAATSAQTRRIHLLAGLVESKRATLM